MASSGHRSHEGYTSSPPSSDPHDPFGSQQNHQRYYDDGSEDPYTQRETYASDNSGHNYPDGERSYDQHGYDPYSALFLRAICHSADSRAYSQLPHLDTDSENDVYGQRYEPSSESLAVPRNGISESSTPTVVDFGSARDAYPAWSTERQIPLSKEEIEDIFLDLTQKFGFQRDSMRNMVCISSYSNILAPNRSLSVHPYQFDFTMQLLDSRASRMSPNQALLTLHADYIGGQNANYRKWYFAAQLDLDDAVGQTQNPGLRRFGSVKTNNKNLKKGSSVKSLNTATERWRQAMNNMSQYDRMRQIALYLLCWGEAAQVRFVPECLCFIFKCADDYYRSPECQSRVQPVKEGLYLQTVIKPLYLFIRDQGYEIVDGRFVRREKDHADIIGYDDVNQLFWYPEGIARIVLNDNVSPPP